MQLLILSILLLIPTAFSFIYPNFIENVVNSRTIPWTRKDVLVDFFKDTYKYSQCELPDVTPIHNQEYDFIIVGAGSAGATIASRLSEIKDVKILLIEAGGHESLFMDVPLAGIALQLDRGWNWHYLTEPSDNYCRGFINKQCRVAMGRAMGGSSSINFMIATRGNRYDYDEWAELTGDNNWSYEGMLQAFKKLETYDVTLTESESQYHGTTGPVRIANAPYRTPLADAFIEAGEELGYSNVDYNGRAQTGFSYLQTNQIHGERLSSNRAYLHPIKGKRKNLFVTMNSHVNRVLINPHTKTAYGVEFTKNGHKYEVFARKEVILSAGAIASPKILMLSGIGPKDHLNSLGINVLQNLPVGENLMDHIGLATMSFLVNETVSIVPKEFVRSNDPTIYNYLSKRTGKLSTAVAVEALAYFNADDPSPENDRADIELAFLSVSLFADSFLYTPFGFPEETYRKLFRPSLHHHAWTLCPLLLKPKSRGKLLLRSKNPKDKPRLFQNYLSHPDDVSRALKAIRMVLAVSKTKAMQRYDSTLFSHTMPGCEHCEFDSDDYWICVLRTFTITIWHQSGTCKMGRESDPTAVVNTRLQVKGIQNLRVADASIMPVIPVAHTNIPTIAIGEKFADILKSDYGYHV